MPLTEAERRRYFRIEDTVGVKFEVITKAEALRREDELKRLDYSSPNRLRLADRQLHLLIDKLRIQNPEFAEALELLNVKINSLKELLVEDLAESDNSSVKKVNISACGISFDGAKKLSAGEKLLMDLTLYPTDLHVFTLGDVVGSVESTETKGEWTIRVDFYGMTMDDEELLVQHIVKRQGKLIGAQRKRQET